MKRIFFMLIIIGFIIFIDAKYVCPTLIKVNEYQIESEKIPSGFNNYKIVHISDIRFNNNLQLIEDMVNKINDQKPDILVFTGNLLTKKINNEEKQQITSLINKINVRFEKFAILGDKDNNQSTEILNECNFTILDNSSKYIFNNDSTPILIVGGDNITSESFISDDEITYNFVIALIHKPDYYDKIKDLNIDITLAGHSLGGEIRLPLWGGLIKNSGSKKYNNEYYEFENNKLYVSFGIGLGKTNLRFLNMPSINVYRLKAK